MRASHGTPPPPPPHLARGRRQVRGQADSSSRGTLITKELATNQGRKDDAQAPNHDAPGKHGVQPRRQRPEQKTARAEPHEANALGEPRFIREPCADHGDYDVVDEAYPKTREHAVHERGEREALGPGGMGNSQKANEQQRRPKQEAAADAPSRHEPPRCQPTDGERRDGERENQGPSRHGPCELRLEGCRKTEYA